MSNPSKRKPRERVQHRGDDVIQLRKDLLEHNLPLIARIVARFVAGEQPRLDAIHEICLKIMDAGNAPVDIEATAWIKRVARNHCIDLDRRDKVRAKHESGKPIEDERTQALVKEDRPSQNPWHSIHAGCDVPKESGIGAMLIDTLEPGHFTALAGFLRRKPRYRRVKAGKKQEIHSLIHLVAQEKLRIAHAIEICLERERVVINAERWAELEPLQKTAYLYRSVGLTPAIIAKLIGRPHSASSISKSRSIAAHYLEFGHRSDECHRVDCPARRAKAEKRKRWRTSTRSAPALL